MPTTKTEPCQSVSNQRVRNSQAELSKCKDNGKSKDRKIKALDKTSIHSHHAIAVGIGAIFGKEALDSITEWLGSIKF